MGMTASSALLTALPSAPEDESTCCRAGATDHKAAAFLGLLIAGHHAGLSWLVGSVPTRTAVVAVTVQEATLGDSQSLPTTVKETRRNLETLAQNGSGTDKQLRELVLDRGYHSNATMTYLSEAGIRSYASEPDRGRRRWHRKREAQRATYANRRRMLGDRGRGLQRKRGELLERSFAHTLETGAMRRVHLRNHQNILKRMLVHVAAFNLGLIMRKHLGHGTPRGLPRSVAQLFRRLVRSLLRLTSRLNLRCHFRPFLPVASATGC